MKTNKYINSLFLINIFLIISGCGSEKSSTTNTTINGKVIDGYIKEAVVFLDFNNNGKYDKSEPKSISDKNGNFEFSDINIPKMDESFNIVSNG